MSDRFHVFRRRTIRRRRRVSFQSNGVIVVALISSATTMAMLRVSATNSASLSGKVTGAAEIRAPFTGSFAALGRIAGMAEARAPGGVILKSTVATMAKAKVSPGYLLFAKAMMAGTALSDPHMEGSSTTPRDPLLLNSGSQFGASYWKGRS